MSYFCKISEETIEPKSEKNHLKSLSHNEFDDCKHIKLTIKSRDINDVENMFYSYVIEHNNNLITVFSNVILKWFFTILYFPHISRLIYLITKQRFLALF